MAGIRWTFGAGIWPRAVLAGLLSVGPIGCHIGTPPAENPLVQGPGGADLTVSLVNGSRVNGELLAVQDSALLTVIDGREVTLIPYEGIRRARFRGLRGEIRLERPSLRLEERLRRRSRYPQGVDAELLERLLTEYGQAALRVLP